MPLTLSFPPQETFDSILILASAPNEEKEVESSAAMDSRSLATLLLIRDIQARAMRGQRHQGGGGSGRI